MPFQALANGIKIEFNAMQNGVPVVNIHNVISPTGVDDSVLEDCALAMDEWWTDDGRALHHSTYVLQNITLTDISVENGHQLIFTSITNPAGTGTGAAAAANAAVVVSWRTANTGRSFRGRTYVGGLANSTLVNAQTIETAAQTAIITAYAGLLAALEAINLTLVVVSRFAAGVARVAALGTEIISIIVDTKVDSQRRRTAN